MLCSNRIHHSLVSVNVSNVLIHKFETECVRRNLLLNTDRFLPFFPDYFFLDLFGSIQNWYPGVGDRTFLQNVIPTYQTTRCCNPHVGLPLNWHNFNKNPSIVPTVDWGRECETVRLKLRLLNFTFVSIDGNFVCGNHCTYALLLCSNV
jgi:hypothetical protein